MATLFAAIIVLFTALWWLFVIVVGTVIVAAPFLALGAVLWRIYHDE